MSDASTLTCTKGHPVAEDQRFCGECGEPLAPEEDGRPRRRLWPVVVPLALVAVAGIAAFALADDDGRETQRITGRFLLQDLGPYDEGGECRGNDGYDDIHEGTQVTVRDQEGVVLGTGELRRSRAVAASSLLDSTYCLFDFSVLDVPEADFYSFEVSRRGEITYEHADMVEKGWNVELNLG